MKRGCVVLADRDVELLEGMRILLEPIFSTIVMVADSPSLVQAAQRLRPDLVVVGMSLRPRDEANAARLLEEHAPGIRFIIVSAHQHPAVLREALAAGASGFILRQTVASELIRAVREVRQDRLFISSFAEAHIWVPPAPPATIQ